MIVGSIHDFDDTVVTFPAVRATSTQVIWYDQEALRKATGESWSEERFLDEFSYVTPDTPAFSGFTLDRDQVRTFKAERYGGSYISDNGGGARVGTAGQFQIKGLGVNQLVGSGKDPFHSYGGFGLREAVAELVSSIVFGRILPHGTVPCYGLIYTTRDGALIYPALKDGSIRRGPGALLVRSAVMRPAHFLRNANFDPAVRRISGDVHRTRRVSEALRRRFPRGELFMRALGQFLTVCADQFGFAHVFRLRHGAMSPSNLALDGRWLDAAYVAFVDSGRSYATIATAIPSKDESMAVLKFVQEFVHTYQKYAGIFFDTSRMASYYLERLSAYTTHYCARLLGLPSGTFESAAKENLRGIVDQLTQALLKRIDGERTLSVGGPKVFNDLDPIVLLIEDLFRHLQPGSEPGLVPGGRASQIAPAFMTLLEHGYTKQPHAAVSNRAFRISCAVRSLRKLYFSSIYYFGGMYDLSLAVAALDNPLEGADIIDEFCEVSQWLFDDEVRGDDWLFKSRRLQISYHGAEAVYLVHRKVSGKTLRFERADALLETLNRLDDDELRVRHFDFRKNLRRMLEVLRCFDRE